MKENRLTSNNKSGFKVPKSYFVDFEAEIMDFVTTPNVEKSVIDSKIDSGFNVPASYFDEVENQITAKLNAHKARGKVIALPQTKSFYYIAGIIACFAIIANILLPHSQEPTFENLELSTIENYIYEGNIDFTFNEISNFIYEEGYVIEDYTHNPLDEEALFEYLKENIDDPLFVIEE